MAQAEEVVMPPGGTRLACDGLARRGIQRQPGGRMAIDPFAIGDGEELSCPDGAPGRHEKRVRGAVCNSRQAAAQACDPFAVDDKAKVIIAAEGDHAKNGAGARR